MSVVISYLKACTFSMTGLVILFNVLTNASSVGSNFWLAHWSNEESASSGRGTDMLVYCIDCIAYSTICMFVFAAGAYICLHCLATLIQPFYITKNTDTDCNMYVCMYFTPCLYMYTVVCSWESTQHWVSHRRCLSCWLHLL